MKSPFLLPFFFLILIKPKEPTAGIRQLSLSEWRLWQDHPLPTHQVDHSDRCHHFISVMQMIEEMRQEEVALSLLLPLLSSSASVSIPLSLPLSPLSLSFFGDRVLLPSFFYS